MTEPLITKETLDKLATSLLDAGKAMSEAASKIAEAGRQLNEQVEVRRARSGVFRAVPWGDSTYDIYVYDDTVYAAAHQDTGRIVSEAYANLDDFRHGTRGLDPNEHSIAHKREGAKQWNMSRPR